MPTPLTNKQKAILGQLARRAWDRLSDDARARACEEARERTGDFLLTEPQAYRDWKHHIQKRAIPELRKGSTLEANQDHFLKLRAAWLDATGDTRAATNDIIAADPEEERRRRALYLLAKATTQRGLSYPEYPATICRTQYRVPLANATPNQLFNLLYTIRNRRKQPTHP